MRVMVFCNLPRHLHCVAALLVRAKFADHFFSKFRTFFNVFQILPVRPTIIRNFLLRHKEPSHIVKSCRNADVFHKLVCHIIFKCRGKLHPLREKLTVVGNVAPVCPLIVVLLFHNPRQRPQHIGMFSLNLVLLVFHQPVHHTVVIRHFLLHAVAA